VPCYWRKEDNDWQCRHFDSRQSLPLSSPISGKPKPTANGQDDASETSSSGKPPHAGKKAASFPGGCHGRRACRHGRHFIRTGADRCARFRCQRVRMRSDVRDRLGMDGQPISYFFPTTDSKWTCTLTCPLCNSAITRWPEVSRARPLPASFGTPTAKPIIPTGTMSLWASVIVQSESSRISFSNDG
jgi:hypothetical protein